MTNTKRTAREVADDLRKRVLNGEKQPGETLATIAELTERYDVARETARAAANMLAAEGLLRSVHRRGFVVQDRVRRRRIRRGQVVTRNPHYGYVFPATHDPSEKWAPIGTPYRSLEAAPELVATTFGVEVGSSVLRRRRVMAPVGEPAFQLVDTWISPAAVADAPQVAEPSTGPGGYLDRLEEAGHGPISWREIIRVRMPSAEEAKLLEISQAMPVFEVAMTGYSGRDDQPIEVTIKVIPSDRVELCTDLIRGDSAAWPVQPVTTS
ncbi:GntR family transcriptional regulator (plasmid) [Streptomyces sp. NEAU-sy36]|uniref:GntR family transcriptional regulator n=1 Tax=unclassified Streptomyces TaxID=2593676 RepID=UPI0015D59CCA|nr:MULTISPECIES: GntR family transcriptional regulator [unclassified Streptomyces]QLJ06704.1 GntR family transcriptional regulator [Streptomyces sp. NEAU-sy36]